jgi:probable O-glycosylation ligase (exosortase A-associated)
MRDVLLTVVIFGLVPVALFHPFVGVALWTWVSVMNPHRLTWSFAYNMPFAQVIAIATLLSLVIAYKKVRFPVTPLTLTLIAFLLWMNVTFLFAIHRFESLDMWSRVNKTLIMTLVAVAAVRSEKQVRILLWILTLSVAFFGVKGGIFTIMTGAEFRVYGPPGSHIEDNNAISVALVMMIPLLVYLYHQSRRQWVRLALVAAILLSAASIFGSYSRGALVAITAMGMFLALKSRKRALFLIVIVIAIPVLLSAMPQKWWDRMATITSTNVDSSVQGRFNAWQMVWNLANDRPIVGGGFAIYEPDLFAKYAPNPLDLHSAHSIYFQVLGEHGFPGLALFLLLALLMWRTGSSVIRNSQTDESRWRGEMARAVQVSMVGFLVGGLTVNIAYWDVYYFLLVLLVALDQLVRRDAAVATQPASGSRRMPSHGMAPTASR